MLIQISNGNTNFFKIIARNIRYLVHINCVIIGIARVIFLMPVIPAVQNQLFMPLGVVKIGIPRTITKMHKSSIGIIYADCISRRSFRRYPKISVIFAKSIPKPNFILLNQRKDFFVCNRVLTPDNQKLLIVFYQLRHIFPEQRKRRICHHNVSLLEICNTFP